MIRSGRSVDDGAVIRTSVCVIGAGPVGLALAAQLAKAPHDVVVLESGAEGRPGSLDEISGLSCESPHFETPEPNLRRQVGGMAAGWSTVLANGRAGARFLPLDPSDFAERSWVPGSGWPITYDDLAPHYRTAYRLLGLATPRAGEWLSTSEPDARIRRLRSQLCRLAPRSRITQNLVDAVAAAATCTLLTDATAIKLEASPSAVGLERAVVRCEDGRTFDVRARTFVLAAGGIESARLTLASEPCLALRLGEAWRNVGRFFMDHPVVELGYLRFSDRRRVRELRYYDIHRQRGGDSVQGLLRVDEVTQRKHRLLNSMVYLVPSWRGDQERASETLARALGAPSRGTLPAPRDLSRILRGATKRATFRVALGARQRRRRPDLEFFGWSALPRVHDYIGGFLLRLSPEQAPDAANRIELTRETDALGMPRARLHWSWTEADVASIRATSSIIAADIVRSGLGWVEPIEQTDGLPRLQRLDGANHHLGTLRMHTSPAHGVTDRDCRCHGVPNLFVAGGATFTTSSALNPTLTEIALAARLSEHLVATVDPSPTEAGALEPAGA